MKRFLATVILFLSLSVAEPCQSLELETKFSSWEHMSQAKEYLAGSCWLCIKDGRGQVFFQTNVNVAGGSTFHQINIPPSGIQGAWVQCPTKDGELLTYWQAGNLFAPRIALGMTSYKCDVMYTAHYFMWFHYGDAVAVH